MSTRPKCSNPACQNPAAIGRHGRVLKYCSNPNCRKHVWQLNNTSARSRKTIADKLDHVQADLSYIKGTLDARPIAAAPAPVKFSPVPVAAFDADDLEIKAATASADDKPTWNFMISSNLSIYGHCDYLPAEIRAYAVRNGRIKEDPKPVRTAYMPSAEAGPKAMQVPQFETPLIEIELEF